MAIHTSLLELIPATEATLRAELSGSCELAAVLGRAVPSTWPPELYDRAALEFVLARLAESAESAGWWTHYFVRRATATEPALVVGAGGYAGPPRHGMVEIGYSVLPEHRRRGYAAEAATGLILRAFAEAGVERVIAHTLPHLTPSIGVLEKCGFRQVEATLTEGAIRFELTRSAWLRWRLEPAGRE